MKETKDDSTKMRNYIPLGRLISNILMESQLIDSLIDYQFSNGKTPLVGRMLNTKGMKNMGIITDVIIPPAKMPKEVIHNRRIPLEDFPIFSKTYPLE